MYEHLYQITITVRKPLLIEDVVRTFELMRYEKNRGSAFNLIANAYENYSEVTNAQKIDIPVLLQWGDKDRVTYPRIGRRLHEEIPNSELIVYEDVGHMIQAEVSGMSVADAIEFIEKVK